MKNIIENIQNKIRSNGSLSENSRKEILDLLEIANSELTELAKTKVEHAESISGFIDRTTHEVMRKEKNPDLIKYSVEGLSASVKGFEVSHPILVENVNYIANTLANMGI